MLMVEIIEGELLEVLHSFQKGKCPGPNIWPIEFFLGLYELVGGHLLRAIKDSRAEGNIHAPLNSTFIALIPKSDKPFSFDNFHPISLCNCLYKIISKVIDRRIKDILYQKISREQFNFFEGKQIHEAIGVAQEWLHSVMNQIPK